MNWLIVSPDYKESKTGLGDHTYYLKKYLSENISCQVATSQSNEKDVYSIGEVWNSFSIFKLLNV